MTKGGQKGVRSKVPDGYYLRTDVARHTGVSVSTLKRWQESGHLTPALFQEHGRVRVALYSELQVEQLLLKPPYRKTGRPPENVETNT